jgi:hypothetical protein
LFNVVAPDTFNELFNVVTLFNIVNPDTYNDDMHDILLFNLVVPDTVNDDKTVALVAIKSYAFTLYNQNYLYYNSFYYMLV